MNGWAGFQAACTWLRQQRQVPLWFLVLGLAELLAEPLAAVWAAEHDYTPWVSVVVWAAAAAIVVTVLLNAALRQLEKMRRICPCGHPRSHMDTGCPDTRTQASA